MTSLTLYGSNVVSTTLSTADQLATAAGGTETSKVTNAPSSGANTYLEFCSQGGTPGTTSSLPATPTGKGWLYDSTALEGQTIAAGNWSDIITISDSNAGSWTSTSLVVRFWKRSSGGSYSSIGSITLSTQTITHAKAQFSFPATSMSAVSFATGDKLYIDRFIQSGTGAGNTWSSDGMSCYVSTSATAGVANDGQTTTPGFSPTPVALSATFTGVGTLSATLTAKTALSATFPGVGTLAAALSFSGTLIDVSAYRALLNTRLAFMNPPIIRTAVPNVLVWCPSGVAGTYSFDNADMLDWLAVFDQAQTMGSTVIVAVNSPSPFASTDAGFATAFSDLLNYLVNTLGYTNIRYVSGLSEPETNGATYTQYKTTIEPNLVSALAANTLTTAVTLLGPDTAMAEDSWLTSSSTDLSSTLGGYVRHAFPTGATDISNDSRETTVKSLIAGIYANDNTNKPIIQGEMGFAYMGPGQAVATFQYGLEMTDYAVQLLRAGMAAPIAYILDDDMHGTQWGFWQITQDTGVPRPWFFPWSLLTQTLVPGSTLYAPVQPTTNDLRVLAAQSPQGAWTFVVVNRRNASQQIQLSIPFAQVATTTLQQYVYSSSAPLIVDGNGFPLPSGTITAVLARGFTVPMAANSVLILSQQTTAQTTIFDVKRPPLQKRR